MLTHTVFQRRYRMKYSEFEEVDEPSRDPPPDPARGAAAPLARRPARDRVGRRRPGRHRAGLVGRVHRLPAEGARARPPRGDHAGRASPRTPARSRSTCSASRSASRTSTSPRTAGSARTRSTATARSTSSRSSSSRETLERLRDNLLLFYTGEARSASAILADQVDAHGERRRGDAREPRPDEGDRAREPGAARVAATSSSSPS